MSFKSPFRSMLALWAVLLSASIVPFDAAGQDRLKLSTVVIDAGHGGHDPGCISADKKTREKDITLDVARRLSRKITESCPGVKTVLTRSNDTFVTLSGRADVANNINADLFISIHVNAQAKGTTASGYSIHCLGQSSKQGNDLFGKNLDLCQRENSVILLEDDYQTRYQGFDPSDPQSYILFSLVQNAHLEHSLIFADDVASAMKGGPIQRSRGVSQDPFWVLWRTTMPSVLVEIGFITNEADLKVMRTEQGRDKIADNLLHAFQTFKKRYDASMATTAKPEVKEEPVPVPAAEPVNKPEKEKEPDVTGSTGIVYGVQVLATSKKMKPDDPFFRGYSPLEVQSGKLYKYLLVPGEDLAAVRKKYAELAKKYPGCFIVSKEGETLTRVR